MTLAAVMLAVGAPVASAATHTVQLSDDAFTSQNLGTITAGDTITWKNNGTHNVVSASIPIGATSFESPIMSGSTATFSQTFTVPGNYRYVCTLHSDAAAADAATQDPGQMVGQFTVVDPGTSVPVPTAASTVIPTVIPRWSPRLSRRWCPRLTPRSHLRFRRSPGLRAPPSLRWSARDATVERST